MKGSNKADIVLRFDDGSEKTELFLAHKPPFFQTSVSGVFAAGDCVAPIKTVAQAIYSGTAVGAGAPTQLQAQVLGHKSPF